MNADEWTGRIEIGKEEIPGSKRSMNRIKGVGKLGWFISRTQTLTSPPREGEPAGTRLIGI